MTMPRTINFILIAIALALVCAPALAQRPDAQKMADEKFEHGRLLLEQGDALGAIPLLRDAAELRKKDADAWFAYGLALSRAGRAKEARKAFEKTLKLRPGDADARTGIAYSLLQLNKPRDAEREARRALKLNPQNAEAHYVVGVIRFREDKFEEATSEAEAALRIKPDLAAAAYLAGDALLGIYFDEDTRQSMAYPLTPAADESTHKAALEAFRAKLAPVRARMLEVADRLEASAKSHPNSPEAEAWREQARTLRFYGRGEGEPSRVYKQSEVTTKAIITYKPEPSFTEDARRNGVTGAVRLRAVLAADGRVHQIRVVKGLPDGLTEKCVAAARKIRFKPATRNGHAVSQYVVLEYNFNIY